MTSLSEKQTTTSDNPMGTPIPDWRNANPMKLEPWFARWMMALTSEGLHDKADIATVLAMQSLELASAERRIETLAGDVGDLTAASEMYEISYKREIERLTIAAESAERRAMQIRNETIEECAACSDRYGTHGTSKKIRAISNNQEEK